VSIATTKKKKAKNVISRLTKAAASIALIGSSISAQAQSAPTQTTVSVAYAHYDESQKGGESRMRVNAPMAFVRAPIGERDAIEASFVYDSMSGASTYYLSSLTGASGQGVEDNRSAGDLKYTHYFERSSLGLGTILSDEDDYNSKSAFLESKWWTEDKNTVLTAGVSLSDDDISSTLNSDLDENRTTSGYLLGVQQVIDEISVFQSNLTFSSADGYLSDPYKTFDNRPQSRDAIAWLNRYIRYIESADASLHADFRYFADSWGINSQTLDLAWYQPFLENWLLRPSIRYYSQTGADFFTGQYPPENFESIYSADQRVGPFGSISIGLKLAYQISEGLELGVTTEFQEQRPEWKLGGNSHSEVTPFYTWYVLTGLTKKF
jgi:hypothetical protein